MNQCLALSLNKLTYEKAYNLQLYLHKQVVDGVLPNLLLLLEHPNVYTLGRRGKETDIFIDEDLRRKLHIEVHRTDRGGEVTYHGPGQLIGYPIVNLKSLGMGPLTYVHRLETILVNTLKEFAIDARCDNSLRGVWIENAKIGAIGVKVSRGITLHGFSLNINPDLSYFDHIVACGIQNCLVTSLTSETQKNWKSFDVEPIIYSFFGEIFDMHMEWSTLEELDRTRKLESVKILRE